MHALVTGEVAPGMRSLGFVVAGVGVSLLTENVMSELWENPLITQTASGQEKSGRSVYFSTILYTHIDTTIYFISFHTNIL